MSERAKSPSRAAIRRSAPAPPTRVRPAPATASGLPGDAKSSVTVLDAAAVSALPTSMVTAAPEGTISGTATVPPATVPLTRSAGSPEATESASLPPGVRNVAVPTPETVTELAGSKSSKRIVVAPTATAPV